MTTGHGADPEDLGGVRLGRYELIKRIAFGGMAEIFLARDSGVKGVSRNVVVKRILPNITEDRAFVDMFLDEARIAARLSHQNIAHVYDFGESDGQFYIAMEHVDGLSLSALLNACRPDPIPIEHAVSIASLVAQALYYAHNIRDEEGRAVAVVHRDVSPQNVLISFDGQVKLVDFGIAKAADQVHQTEAGVLKGKYAYMAPEQCIGLPYDHRVDLFSLGTLLHEALTGSRLFKRDNAFQTMQAVTTEPIPKPSDKRPELPARLDGIVMRALARNPKDRYPSADELAVDLELFLQEERLISNQILLGRFISQVLSRGDRPRPTGVPHREAGSAPGWSSSPAQGERVSPSEISRLRRVVRDATPEDSPAAAAAPPIATIEEAPSEAEGDTAQHDVSFLSGLDSGWSGGSEGLPPPSPRAEPAAAGAPAFEVPPPPAAPERRTAAPTEPELAAYSDAEAALDPTSEMEHPPGRVPGTSEPVPALPVPRSASPQGPRLPAPTDEVPVSDLVDLAEDDDDDHPTEVSEREVPAEEDDDDDHPTEVSEREVPSLEGSASPAEQPVAPAAAEGPHSSPARAVAGESEPVPGPFLAGDLVLLGSEPTAPDLLEAKLPSRFGLAGLLAVSGVVALVAFVVVIAYLGLRSVVREPADPTGPSTSVAETAGEPSGPVAPPRTAPAQAGPPASVPGPAPLSAPATGTLVVAAEDGDDLDVDGAPARPEAARAGLAVEPGEHALRVERQGYRPWSKRVAVAAGERAVATPELEPDEARPGKLYVNSRPWSEVFVDGRSVGNTPIVALSVSNGRHSLKLVTADGRSERRAVAIKSGRPSKVFVTF